VGTTGKLLLVAIFLFTCSPKMIAATFTWTGDSSTNQLWSNGANWGGVAPTSAGTTDLIFAGTTNVGTSGLPLNNNIATPFLLNSISFSSGAGAFFLGGNSLQFNGAGDTITQNSSSAISIANVINATGKTGNNTETITLTGNGSGVVTMSGTILTGNGQRDYAITKSGTSTFVLSGANTYGGGTTVSAGTLFVNNSSGSGTGTGTVTVNGTGTLGGSGTISGAVNVSASGARINAGGTAGAVGTLATGALTLSSASVMSVDMTSTTADRINVTGAVNITSASLQLNIPNGTVFTTGQTFTLISNDLTDAISGTFSNAPAGTDTIDGYLWLVSYTGGDGNDFTIQAVPEPSTWSVAALALGAIVFAHRRKARRSFQLSTLNSQHSTLNTQLSSTSSDSTFSILPSTF
jgi:autotransporter-associated beta strand protein